MLYAQLVTDDPAPSNADAPVLVDPERVAATRDAMIAPPEAAAIAELFRLLGDATRARILFALLEAGELCVGDLVATLDMPESRLSHALRLMRTAGMVRNRRDGRLVFYSLDDDHVRELLQLSFAHLQHERDEGPGSA